MGDSRDARRAFRITIDVLAEPDQIAALQTQLTETLCQAPDDHQPPCRFAWSIATDAAVEGDEDGASLTRAQAEHIVSELMPIEVWPAEAVNDSLGMHRAEEDELDGLGRGSAN